MEWTGILIPIVTALLGGGGAWFFTLKATRRKAGAEATNTEITGLNAAIDALKRTIESLTQRQEEDKRMRAELEERITSAEADKETLAKERDTLQEQLLEKKAENLTASQCACFHYGCVIRKPILGCGKDWFEKFKGTLFSEENKVIDYDPIEVLLQKYYKTTAKGRHIVPDHIKDELRKEMNEQ